MPEDDYYDPASVAWSGPIPQADRTTLVIHTPNGKDDPLYLKLAEQCIKHGWVILRMEDDGTVYDDMLGALGEGVLRQRVISQEEAQAMFDSNDRWTPEQDEFMAALAAAEGVQATREKARGTWLLSDDIVRGAYLKPRSARALLEYGLSKLAEHEAATVALKMCPGDDVEIVKSEGGRLIRGEIGKLLGVTVHKTSPAVVGMQSHALADSIKRQRAERKRQSQAELAKIRKRKGGY